jgi:hypothetical protein
MQLPRDIRVVPLGHDPLAQGMHLVRRQPVRQMRKDAGAAGDLFDTCKGLVIKR